MFCDQCGGQLQAGQQVCTRCGKPVLAGVMLRRNRVQEHVRLLGIFWMAYSALAVVGGVVLMLIANTLFGRGIFIPNMHPPEASLWLRPFLSFLGGLILIKGAVGFAAGWGLLQREAWARVLALIIGFIALFNVPIGTALGIYTLWVLLSAHSDEEYQALSAAA